MPILTAFVLAIGASLLLTPPVRRLAWRLGAVDRAHGIRRVHRAPVPRLGGLAIAGGAGLAAGTALLGNAAGRAALIGQAPLVAALITGALGIIALGLRDDLRGVSPAAKLAVECGVGALLFAAGLRVDTLSLPQVGAVELGWLSLPVTLLWLAGVTNAVNLIDGLDGRAGGVAALAAAALGVMALLGGQPLVALLAAALVGAALGFLRHNAFPATIFMGDTGSLFLGFSLAALSLKLLQGPMPAAGLAATTVALGLPLADTALAVARRALRGAPLFRADRGHLHHRLLACGLSHRGAVWVLWAASLALASAAVLVAVAGDGADLAVLAALAAAGAAALWRLGLLHPASLGPALAARRRNLARRAGLRALARRLRKASDLAETWAVVRAAADLLGATGVALRVPAGSGQPESSYDAGDDAEGMTRARAALAGRLGERLELRFREHGELDRDTEIALELLGGEVERTLARLRRRSAARLRPVDLAPVPASGRATRT